MSGGILIKMEKNAVFGELLYVGLVFEKGRCRSSGIWKRSYSKSLKKHIGLLREIAKCMQKEFDIENDNYLLRKVYNEIQCDDILKKFYPFNVAIDEVSKKNYLITVCNNNNKHMKIIELMIKLFENILFELDKGFKKDKDKISRLVFALHNLPRVYLSKEECTLCMLGQDGINLDMALEYSKMSMNEEVMADLIDVL